jgi:hypothetical protein
LSYGGTVSLKKECHQHPHEWFWIMPLKLQYSTTCISGNTQSKRFMHATIVIITLTLYMVSFFNQRTRKDFERVKWIAPKKLIKQCDRLFFVLFFMASLTVCRCWLVRCRTFQYSVIVNVYFILEITYNKRVPSIQ